MLRTPNKSILFLTLLFVCIAHSALAYVAPVHFQVQKITAGRPVFQNALIEITVLKPAQDNHSIDEALEHTAIIYNPNAHWPVLPLLLEANPTSLRGAWQAFGPLAPTEADLAIHKPEQLRTLENPPRPFYSENPQLSLKRFPGGIAFASTSDDGKNSILVDRDTFIPISVVGPCPQEVNSLSWIHSTGGQCHVDFERGFNFRIGLGRTFRFYLKNEKQNLLIFRIDSVKTNLTSSEISSIAKKQSQEKSSAVGAIVDSIFR